MLIDQFLLRNSLKPLTLTIIPSFRKESKLSLLIKQREMQKLSPTKRNRKPKGSSGKLNWSKKSLREKRDSKNSEQVRKLLD